jgi:hypothetical protein
MIDTRKLGEVVASTLRLSAITSSRMVEKRAANGK